MSILDEFVFEWPPLKMLSPLNDRRTGALSVRVGRGTRRRSAEFASPWVICDLASLIGNPPSPVEQLPSRSSPIGREWLLICQQLRAAGILLECSRESLAQCPVDSVPKRLCRMEIDRPFSAIEPDGASLIEITCRSGCQGDWGWPPEIGDFQHLRSWLQSAHLALGQGSLLGLGIPLSVHGTDLGWLKDPNIDWIALHCGACDTQEAIVHALVRLRTRLQELERADLPILVRAGGNRPNHLIKLIALGATWVGIDGLLDFGWTRYGGSRPSENRSGYLSSLQPVAETDSSQGFHSAIEDLNQQLASVISQAGVRTEVELKAALRATTARAAHLTCVPMLGESVDHRD
jgi:hypothetical protein